MSAATEVPEIRGWREPGNKTLQRSRIFGLVLFMRGLTDQEGRPAWQSCSKGGVRHIESGISDLL